MFESVDEVGHLAHIGNLWIIRQQLEHFLYPETKLELACESRLYNKGFPRKYRLRVPNLKTAGVSPELGRLDGCCLLIDENCPDVRGSFRMYQCFILLLRRQVLNVAAHVMIKPSAYCGLATGLPCHEYIELISIWISLKNR